MGVYAEYVLPPHRHIALPQSSSFPNLNFALYLGRQQQEHNLVEATTYQLPIGVGTRRRPFRLQTLN